MKIAIANSRTARTWKNIELSWNEFCEKIRETTRTYENVTEFYELEKSKQDNIKDVGGFVGGFLKDGIRKKGHVVSRQILTLDTDYGRTDTVETIEMLYNFKGLIYSTHKHTPQKPRLRLVILLSREVTETEYEIVSKNVAYEIGEDLFDPTTHEPHRLMYWPSTSKDGEYVFVELDGDELNPDDYLEVKEATATPKVVKEVSKQEDPETKDGIVGAFCRTYGICDAIETFLADVYTPSALDGRYDYIPASSSAGVEIFDDKFAYSHHATDPACSRLCNAFDLVRIHKFGECEKSYDKMCEFAVADEKTSKTILLEKRAEATEDFKDEDWESKLKLNKKGEVINTLQNLTLILENDPKLCDIWFNRLADNMEIRGSVPWRNKAKYWRDADDAQLTCYIDSNYGNFTARNYQVAVAKVVDDRSYHPILEYFENLPKWDGVPRIDTLLIDYLGAEDNPYVRAVTRKTLCAGVSRVQKPGVKFDNILVLNGSQGIGKSTLVSKIGGAWYSDSLSISDMQDKTAAEKLQGYWIMEIGELAGMKKADIDKVKAFISRQDDKYRASFGRRVTPHLRQCVFFGTTNAENGFLRDVTGNRRFWNVTVGCNSAKKPWDITKNDVEQIWAETIVKTKAGEKLFLDDDKVKKYAEEAQTKAMEQDDREGLVTEYLDTLLPKKWGEMDIHERRNFIEDPSGPTSPKGEVKRTTVSNIEIWCECFGKRKEDLKSADSYGISAIMARIDGWEKNSKMARIPIYGMQRGYKKM